MNIENNTCKICGKVHNGKHSSYFNEGTIKEIAFVFSCPGRFEKNNNFPISGETGKTFDLLLKMMKEKGIIKEKYDCRFDFRITNATINIEYKEETGKSQANDLEVKKDKNIQRLFSEIKDFKRIICFGRKAEIAVLKMKELKDRNIIYVRHLSTQAFRNEKGIDKTRIGRAKYVFDELDKQLKEFKPQKNETGKYGFANAEGKIIIPFEYEWICDELLREQFLLVQKNDKIGMIDLNNKTIIPFEYEKPIKFNNYSEFLIIKRDKKDGVLDFQGNVVIPFEYDTVFENDWYNTPCFKVEKNNKWGIVDRNNNIVLPIEYSFLSTKLIEEQIVVIASKNDKYGIIELNGKIILPFEYEYIDGNFETEPSSLEATKDEKCTLINLSGKPII